MYFDLNRLLKESGGNPNVMLKMLYNYYYKLLPKNKWEAKNFSKASLSGDSFILHPERLFNAKVDVNYKIQFIVLAAKRDLLFYRQYGVEYLDLSFFPDLDVDKLRGNPLLEVSNNKLIFKI